VLPDDSRRAAANQARLTERNLAIAGEVDRVADSLGATSAQVAAAWVRSRGVIPLGTRKLEQQQLKDTLGTLEVELPAEHRARLDEVSRIELGFPYELLRGPQGQMVHGDLEPRIELPSAAPIRWRYPSPLYQHLRGRDRVHRGEQAALHPLGGCGFGARGRPMR
jgi:Aldo/keto reductase family